MCFTEKVKLSTVIMLTILTIATLKAQGQIGNSTRNDNATFIPQKTYSSSINEMSRAYYNEGTALLQKGKYHSAIDKLLSAVNASENNVDAWDHLGVCYRRIGDYKKAVAAYEKSLQINPANPVPYVNLGLIYSRHLNDMKKAVYYYEKMCDLDSTDPEGPYGLSVVYEKAKDYQAAIRWCEKALKLYKQRKDPLITHAYYRLGILYATKPSPDNIRASNYFIKAERAGLDLPEKVKKFVDQVRNSH